MTTDPQTMNDLVSDLTIAQELAIREASISKINFLPTTSTHTLYCQYTGTPIASIALIHQAGRAPYLKEWQQSIVVHPLFSLSTPAILSWTRKNWNRVFRDASDHATDIEKLQFQIAFVAVLHTLDAIKQEVPILPSFSVVQRNMQSLLEIAYWKFYLDSKRFRFPTLRINKLNANTALEDIGAYFAVCNSVRADWETKRENLAAEETKIETARRVERLVRGSHVRAVSKKALWNWFIASIMAKNKRKFELDEWKEWLEDSSKLWFASESARLQFSVDDLQSIEDVFIQECELGTTISHTFQKELNAIRKAISDHVSMWDIDWDETDKVNRTDADGNMIVPAKPADPGPEPHIGSYRARFDYLKALAAWKMAVLAVDTWEKKYDTGNSNNAGKEQ